MRFDRRHLLAASCALLAMRGSARAAGSQDHAVFWTVSPPGAAPSILFGYDVIAAAAAPNLLATGQRLAVPTRHLIMDMPSARFPTKRVKLDKMPPLDERYGPAAKQQLVDVLRTTAPQLTDPDILPGTMIAFLLIGEGRTPNGTGDTLPGTLFTQLFQSGEATSYLFPFDEILRKNLFPDVGAAIGRDLMLYLLDLRTKLGPLGKYTETLYVQERLYDLWRFHLDLQQHGFSGLRPNIGTWIDTLADRAVDAIKSARKPTFLMLPSDNFVRDDGILSRLARSGLPVTPAG